MKQPFYVAVFSAVVSIWLTITPAFSQNEAFEAAEKVPASIHYVNAGSYWQQGKKEGFFRAVVVAGGVEHVSHRMFLQWLQIDPDTQAYELVRTVNVKELNLGQGYVLEVKPVPTDFGSFRIDVTANARGGSAKKFSIKAGADGSYKIQAR